MLSMIKFSRIKRINITVTWRRGGWVSVVVGHDTSSIVRIENILKTLVINNHSNNHYRLNNRSHRLLPSGKHSSHRHLPSGQQSSHRPLPSEQHSSHRPLPSGQHSSPRHLPPGQHSSHRHLPSGQHSSHRLQ